MSIYLDAGTTYSKIIVILSPEERAALSLNDSEKLHDRKEGSIKPLWRCAPLPLLAGEDNLTGKGREYENIPPVKIDGNRAYYIIESKLLKDLNLKVKASCGHMTGSDIHENEIIALANGAKPYVDENATILDLGSRDAKWISFKDGKFHDMDWNTSCASSTGATVEMLLKFYDLKVDNLEFNPEKFNITCGIFGFEKIMDSISKGESPKTAVSKFVHGLAYNAWNFSKKPQKLYLSGGFCENKCLVESLKNYCEVVPLGRFILCEGLIDE